MEELLIKTSLIYSNLLIKIFNKILTILSSNWKNADSSQDSRKIDWDVRTTSVRGERGGETRSGFSKISKDLLSKGHVQNAYLTQQHHIRHCLTIRFLNLEKVHLVNALLYV